MISRRTLLALSLAAVVACKREARCENCGMKLDATSAWTAEILIAGATKRYDTPRCALVARLGTSGRIRVQEFYDRKWRDGVDVRFVSGSDVLGPMGEELVPVDPARTQKFVADHGGAPFALVEIPSKLLK